MEMNDLISVIVPVYNIEQYLPACIESILAQTYTNLEIILVDDGATDNSGKICDEYAAKDFRIRVIHKPNGGVSSARNAGIDAATGTLIGFVDGDDTIMPEMYQTLYSDMCRYEADIVCCGYKAIWRDKIELHNGTGKLLVYEGHQGAQTLLTGKNIEPSLWNKLYCKKLFCGVRFNERIRFGEDLLVNFYVFYRAKKAIFHDICLYYYRHREGSCTSSTFGKKDLDLIDVSRIMLVDLQECGSDLCIYGEKRLVSSLISTYNHSLKHAEYEELRKNILCELKGKRKKIMSIGVYSKTQKIAVLLMTTCPPLYHAMLRVRNYRYRYRKIGNQ